MADALALYRAVMGQVWEDELPRVRAQREAGAARQGRGWGRRPVPGRSRGWTGGPWGRPSARDLMRAAAGGQAAVFKRIRAGGCKSPRALRDQLSYVNDKAVFVTSTLVPEPQDGVVLSPSEKMEIVDAFTERWAGTTKLGHSSHMLLSFPEGVETETVRDVAVEWAERLFESGHYGDTWDYVLAVHDDRDHKHAHVVLNNRGRDHGTWFSCWREGVMSPQHMREVMADVAAEHGVMLEATARLERGLATEPAGMVEVYAARDDGRARDEPAMDIVRRAEAEAAHARFAAEQSDLAELLDDRDHPALARATRAMSESVSNGQPWEADMAARTAGATISVDEVRTVGDAIDWAEARWDGLDAQMAQLGPDDRARFEIEAAEVKADLVEFVPDAQRRLEWSTTMSGTYPPGAELAGRDRALEREGLAQARPETVEEVLIEGRQLGLDVDEMTARLEAGGTRSMGLAQEWTDRDADRILVADDIEPGQATPAQRDAAIERLDAFQDRLRGAMLEAGAEERMVVDLAEARASRGAEAVAERAEPALEAREEVPEAAVPPTAAELRERERAEQAAYLASHPELLRSPGEVYTMAPDGSAELRPDGEAPRVMRELEEMGVTGREEDAEARIAAALSERHPDMPGHVARDLAITYAGAAELVDRQGGLEQGSEAEAQAAPDLPLQAIADRLRREDLAPEEREEVAAALEANLQRRLGSEAMARLDDGDRSVLEGVVPERDQITIAEARIGRDHEMRGEIDEATTRRPERRRELDDDMGL